MSVPILGTNGKGTNNGSMKKTIAAEQYLDLINWLTAARVNQGLGMRALAERLGRPHSFVQKVESFERRLDVFEYVTYCNALGVDPSEGLRIMERETE